MPASPNESISGRVQLEILFEPPDEEGARDLPFRLDCFLSAVRSRMFTPGELRAVEEWTDGPTIDPPATGCWRRAIEVAELPVGAFRVLRGMLIWHDKLLAPVRQYTAHREGESRNLLLLDAALPDVPVDLAFEVEIAVPQRTAAPLNIDVEFRNPPPESDRASLAQCFSWWDEMVNGGYPVPATRGTSGVGAASTRFPSPQILHHHLEGWAADPACFAPVLELARSWSHRYGVRRVTAQ